MQVREVKDLTGKKFRNYCWTLNNYTDEDEMNIQELFGEAKYVVYGREIGQNGTPHLQGYIEFKNPRAFNAVCKLLGGKAHVEARRGTAKEAADYCKKDGNVFEIGEISNPNGVRKDHEVIRENLSKGIKIGKLLEEGVLKNAQAISFAEKYLKYTEKPRTWKTEVWWISGPSGCGKSKLAWKECGIPWDEVYVKSVGKFFDGYDGQEVVILDDFRVQDIELAQLLRLMDRYPERVEIKGGSRMWKCDKLIITSIKTPEECYEFLQDEPLYQITRRIDMRVTWDGEKFVYKGDCERSYNEIDSE